MTINGRKLLPWLVLVLLVIFASSIAERSMNKMANISGGKQSDVMETESLEGDSISTLTSNKKDPVVIQSDFFIDYKLEREVMRGQQIELLKQLLDSTQNTKEINLEIKEQLTKIINITTLETEIESLIKAKGFNDAVIIVHEDTADAIIKTEDLNQEQAIQISDLVTRVAKVSPEGVRIIPRP